MDALPEEPIDLQEYHGDSSRMSFPYRIRLTPRDARVASVLAI